MKNLIYEQGDKKIASSVLHKIISGRHPDLQEKIIDSVFSKHWSKLMSWSTWLGNMTSTAIGLYIIGKTIKFTIDTLIHGRILYDIYGFGWQLLASFWDSLTNFLSHRSHAKQKKDSSKNDEIIEIDANTHSRNGPCIYPKLTPEK
uniref:Uncharacterized protein n=1 Tax=Anopheles albimanus TaxID=7167 RepID=A0A182FMP0_ANOAL